MASTHLGWRDEFESRIVLANVTGGDFETRFEGETGDDADDTSHWNHNSPYWREIGSPWAGVHTTTADIAHLLQVMLDGGRSSSGTRVFEPGTVRMMLQDYTMVESDISMSVRLHEGWVMDWRIQRAGKGGWVETVMA